jgi:hypothetical protein
MTGIRKGDDVWKCLPFRVVRWELIPRFEFAGYRLQAVDEVCFIRLSKGSSLQVEWDLSTVGGGTEEELANLFLEFGGNIVDIRETAWSDSGTILTVVGLHLRLEEWLDIFWREIVEFCFPLQVVSTSSNAKLGDVLAIRKTSDDGADPYDGRLLYGGTVVSLLAAVKPDGLVPSQAARMVGVAAHEADQPRGFRAEMQWRRKLVVRSCGNERTEHEHFVLINMDLQL